MPLQVRRGTDAERLAMTQPLASGELLYVTNQLKLYVGDGATLGGIQITGYTDGDAKDSAAEIFTDGSHTGINFAYNTATNVMTATVNLSDYAGTIRADAFKGSVFADDGSTIGGQPLVDAISGTFNGNLSGTILTAAQPNITSLGTLTSLAVTGAVSGSQFTGNIFTNLIDSADSSAIQVTPSMIFNSDVTLENDLIVENIILNGVEHSSIGDKLFPTPQLDEPQDHYLTFVDGVTGKTTVKTDGNLRYNPLSKNLIGTGFLGTSVSAPSVTTTNLLTSDARSNGVLILYSVNDSANADQFLVSVGSQSNSGRFRVSSSVSWGSFSIAEINQHHATADASNFQFNRSRGTAASPTTVQIGDDLADITFSGYDGGAYRVKASISATVDGAISTNVVPTKLTFATSGTSSAPATAMEIDSNQRTTFSGAITLATYADATARNTAIPTPTAGMMVYISGTGKFQGYNGLTTTWDDLN
jgi:hypothetical protein